MPKKKQKKFAPAPDQKQRDLILKELDTNLLVEAAAGTGKTTSMVGRMIALIETGKCSDISHLAAVTFTRKAAAELRSRFQIKLEAAAQKESGVKKKRLVLALERLEQCYVGTIHSFCARLLRERPVEAKVDLSFESIEPEEDIRIRREAWNDYCAKLYIKNPDGIIEELGQLGLSLTDLEDCFIQFAEYPDVDEWPTTDFGNKVFEAIEKHRPLLKKYISHIEEVMGEFPEDIDGDKLIVLYKKIVRMAPHFDLDEPVEFMRLLEEFNVSGDVTLYKWYKNSRFTKQDAKDELAKWQDFQTDVMEPLIKLWCERRYEPILRVITGASESYDSYRASRGLLNYQDLLLKSAALLRDKPHIRKYFASRYTHLLVDEFHDTDPIQAEMMMLLTADKSDETNWRACLPRPGSLFVVGDPKQSIYRFRRADIVTYNEVKEIIKRGGKLVQLSANFRSSPQIIDWVNTVFGPDENESDINSSQMLRFADTDSEMSPAYVPMQVGLNRKIKGPLLGLRRLDADNTYNQKEVVAFEADFIARTIRHALDSRMEIPRTEEALAKGTQKAACPSDFMIITYNTMNLSHYGQALQNYGIPHQVTGGAALNEVEELKDLHRCLKAVIAPDNPVSLVAALRSRLFGVSDASLYAFKKAGGYFSYRAGVPDKLAKEHAEPIREAFDRLANYANWLLRLPHIAAFERILGDLGLMVQASLKPGGDVEAGSLAKALEIIRGAQKGIWSVTQLVGHLGDLIETTEKHDGVSARPGSRSVVRVMNLHKVKGLEANVVFLACPFGENKHLPSLHVDRSKYKVVGYLSLSKKKSQYQTTTLALPPNWEALQAREAEFALAEKLRLRYVAATRAGCALVITNYEGKNQSNPWNHFVNHIPDSRVLDDPGRQTPPKQKKISITKTQVKKGGESISSRLAHASLPTYNAGAAKAFAMKGAKKAAPPAPKVAESYVSPGSSEIFEQGEHGVEWGSVIHRLLEVAMLNPKANLLTLAGTLLTEYELDENLAGSAKSMVASVIKSDIWKRAQKSGQRFTEIPFQVLLDAKDGAKIPTVVRGSIDLVFKEQDGWTLVDYKTDTLKGTTTAQLAKKYAPQVQLYAKAWEKCTGEKVARMGLLFSRGGELVEVPPSP